MVRILEVKHLQERRRLLVARSQMHRQIMGIEFANIKVSVVLLKQQFGVVRVLRRIFTTVSPLATAFLSRRHGSSGNEGGFLSRLASGLKFALELMPLFKKSAPSPTPSPHEPVSR